MTRIRAAAASLCLAAPCLACASGASARDLVLRAFGGAVSSGIDGGSDEAFDLDYDTGWLVGGAVGTTFGRLTIEGELAHRNADLDAMTVTVGGVPVPLTGVHGDLGVTSLLADAWYEAPLSERLSLYVGGGLGAAVGDASVGTSTQRVQDLDLDTSFAWQAGAGVRYEIDDRISIGAGYRRLEVPDFTSAGSGDYVDDAVIAEVSFRL